MEEKIKVIIKEPGEPPREEIIENELKTFQKIVDGYIETIRPLKNKIVVMLNDFGKLNRLKPNFWWFNDIIVGTTIFTKSDSQGEFVSLNERDIK